VKLPAAATNAQKWACESTAINAPIQGSGADQKYLALACVRDEMHRHGARLLLDLHDGLYFVVPDEKAESFAVRTHHIMSTLPYKQAWGIDLPVAFPVDTKWGKTWGDLEKTKI
jgi:DNA polymerase-1